VAHAAGVEEVSNKLLLLGAVAEVLA
jgi:hypothetical protein